MHVKIKYLLPKKVQGIYPNFELTASKNCNPLFSLMTPFYKCSFSMGPMDPTVENSGKNTVRIQLRFFFLTQQKINKVTFPLIGLLVKTIFCAGSQKPFQGFLNLVTISRFLLNSSYKVT